MENLNTSDTQIQWKMLDAEYKRRIETPEHYEMQYHISTYISQEDYNFFRELSRIKDEYFDWQAGQESVMDYPAVIADKELRKRYQKICCMLSLAYRNLKEKAMQRSKTRFSEFFKMKNTSPFLLN
jgi:hypothetical protein